MTAMRRLDMRNDVTQPAFGAVCLVRLRFGDACDVRLMPTSDIDGDDIHFDGIDVSVVVLGATAVSLDVAAFDHAERLSGGRGMPSRSTPVTAHGRVARMVQARATQGITTSARARPTRLGWEILSITTAGRS